MLKSNFFIRVFLANLKYRFFAKN